ncbi:glycosyltransferase [Dactylosporangium sp. NPDC051541]|uniref:glycosyltransferase n=1 Tax=Dactylosporangium sp. NPDC051541 TaxID=3363977 RepID=UPI0037A46786
MVRVAIMAVGSRGDVAPYAGLGVRLQESGHRVTIATHGVFEEHVRRHGLGFHPLPLDTQEQLAARLPAGSPARAALAWNRVLAEHATPIAAAMLAAARTADVLLLTPASWLGAHIAEGLNIPSMGTYLQPMTPTREFPPPALTTRSLGAWGNDRAARFLLEAGQRPYRDAVGKLRAELGLPPITAREFLARAEERHWPIFYGYSPIVVPPPPDWDPAHRATGYWWPPTDPAFKPPEALEHFLSNGPPPVYIGFGSMPSRDPAALSALLLRAIRRAGVRAVVSGGWAALDVTADDVCTVADVPHEWLFPQVAAVVHHAGAGTTGAGLRAGVPAVPVPHAVDQPFWARRLTDLGVTPGPIPRRRLTADRLAEAIAAAVRDPVYRHRAEALAVRLSEEDGARPVLRALSAVRA